MKPKKNRIYCNACGGVRMLFPTEKKADNFIRFNADEIMDETGKAPVRSYYCSLCGGWHVTSSSSRDYYESREYAETFDLKQCHKVLDDMIRNLRHAYITRAYEDCYKYIEDAYGELERAAKAGFDSSEFPNVVRWLVETAGGLHRYFRVGNPKLNLCIGSLEKLIVELRNAAYAFTDDFSTCEKLLDEIDVEMKNAIRFGASEKRLKKYHKVYAKYSSPQKIRLEMERKELYSLIVDSYRKKNYQECKEAIKLSYQNFYHSLNEGVDERDIQSAMKRIERFKEFVEKLEEKTDDVKALRGGWSEAFAKYAEEGEDEMLLPNCVDNDGETE